MSNEPNARPESFWGGWHNRLRALRNVPPVLRVLWEAGRGSVALNLVSALRGGADSGCRAGCGRQIINIVAAVSSGRPGGSARSCGGGSALEFALAGAGALLGRGIDYFDSVLADKFTRHLSVKIMAHASRLDLASYEDPVFYDKLERARVQATDRLGMIQAIGRLLQQGVTTDQPGRGDPCVLALAAGDSDRLRAAGVSGRKPLRVPGILAELPADACPPPIGLPARAGRQPRKRQRAEAVRT